MGFSRWRRYVSVILSKRAETRTPPVSTPDASRSVILWTCPHARLSHALFVGAAHGCLPLVTEPVALIYVIDADRGHANGSSAWRNAGTITRVITLPFGNHTLPTQGRTYGPSLPWCRTLMCTFWRSKCSSRGRSPHSIRWLSKSVHSKAGVKSGLSLPGDGAGWATAATHLGQCLLCSTPCDVFFRRLAP